jgi:DNA-binding NarL/FixJ family response regulator
MFYLIIILFYSNLIAGKELRLMGKNISILLVEDDLNISTLLIDLLESNNYDVIHVKDGLKAIDTIKKRGFDLILLDEVMPMMNGSELLVRLKADHKTACIPVIMMTSLQDDEHQVNVLREGADDYIQKPFRFNVLLARIEVVLRKEKASYPIDVDIPEGSSPQALTPKEKEVLSLIIKGYNNSKIAKELYISDSTVSNHMQSIFNKLKAESRTHAAIIALKYNIF